MVTAGVQCSELELFLQTTVKTFALYSKIGMLFQTELRCQAKPEMIFLDLWLLRKKGYASFYRLAGKLNRQ